jgi:hypothetical protein
MIIEKNKNGNWIKFDIKAYCKPYEKEWAEFDWETWTEDVNKGIYNQAPVTQAYIPNPKGYGPVVHIQLFNREEIFKDTDEIIRMLHDGTKIRETIGLLEVIEW